MSKTSCIYTAKQQLAAQFPSSKPSSEGFRSSEISRVVIRNVPSWPISQLPVCFSCFLPYNHGVTRCDQRSRSCSSAHAHKGCSSLSGRPWQQGRSKFYSPWTGSESKLSPLSIKIASESPLSVKIGRERWRELIGTFKLGNSIWTHMLLCTGWWKMSSWSKSEQGLCSVLSIV